MFIGQLNFYCVLLLCHFIILFYCMLIFKLHCQLVLRICGITTRRGQTTTQMFRRSWVFHIISHYLKSIDSFYTKLGRWARDLLPIIFTWKVSVNVNVVTSQWWRHVFPTFEVFNMHNFYNVFKRAHQRELRPEKILSISQKLKEIWHF